jgi:hypothetical protein
METRNAYKEKYEAQLKEWGARVDVIKAQAQKLNAQVKIDVASHVDRVHERYAAAKVSLEDIARATDDKWNDARSGADRVWHDLEHAVEGALAALKPHAKTVDPEKKR